MSVQFEIVNRLFISALLTVSATLCPVMAFAPQETWQRIAPIGESFTVLMPDRAFEATRRIPLNEKDWIPERVYYSLAGGKRFMVLSFLKTSPERVQALSSFDNFLTSIEQSFKTGENDVRKSLAFDRDIPVGGYIVKQYHVTVGEYPGVARFLGTEKAFYALMVIGADEKNAEVLRFLSSFVLGEANTSAQSSGVILNTSTTAGDPSAKSTDHDLGTLPPEPWPRTVGPIIGGVLNGKAISLPKPEYPKEARNAGDSGTVEVQIVIDEHGGVITATASSGPMSLREAAVRAALKARFSPTKLMGQPVKVSGRIIYNFVHQ